MEGNQRRGKLKLYTISSGKVNVAIVARSSREAIKKFFNNIKDPREDFENGVLGETVKISARGVTVSYEVLPILVVLEEFSKKEGVDFLIKTGFNSKTSALLINILVEKYRWIKDDSLAFGGNQNLILLTGKV